MRRTVLAALFATCTALCAVAPATARADGDPPAPPPAPAQDVETLEREITELFAAKKYPEVAEKCRALALLAPKHPNPPYNLACALARSGKKEEALVALAQSVELGFDDPDHMKADEDLASLRGEKTFAELVEKAAAATYDPGIEIVRGAKSLDRAPEGGLRCRLLVPESASAEKPARLIVWLHPSGGSMNDRVESDAEPWIAAGFALLVPTQKSWRGWSETDWTRLADKSIPDAGGVAGVDAKRPILVGFSAGGQAALMAWAKAPERFGGIVVDAAYPIDVEAYRQGEMKYLAPTPEASKTPVFVLVGDADQSHMSWKVTETPFRDAGVPLVVHYVEGGKHAWLLNAEWNAKLTQWLKDVAAGKLPGAEEKAAAPVEPK